MKMTVKEIFELRRQGKIEEAYDAIRPLYAAHKGRYTSLCMFWTAADIFKKRIDEGRTEEAAKIYEALKRVLPYIKDSDPRPDGHPQQAAIKPSAKPQPDDGIPCLGIDKGLLRTTDSAAAFMQSAARRLTVARQHDKQQALAKSKQENSSNSTQEDFSALSALSASKKEDSSNSTREDFSALSALSARKKEDSSNSSNSCSKTDQEANSRNSHNSPLKETQEEVTQEQAKKLRSSEADFREFRVFATFRNPQEEAISAVSAVSASQEEDPSSSQVESSNSSSSSQEEDLSGHLVVSLDEGIIRPIEGLNAPQRVVLACVVGHPGYSVPHISESTGIPQKSIERHISVLVDRGLIEHRDSKKSGGFYPL